MRDRFLKYVFDRYMAWRLDELVAPSHAAILDYPIHLAPRYGYGKPPHPRLNEIIGTGRERYAARLGRIVGHKADFIRIATGEANGTQPTFGNSYFAGLDAMALYALMVELDPKRYFEVGSGNSTKFARRAIADHELRATVTSVDPSPRADVDEICDSVVRGRLEDVDPAMFDALEPGDVLFIDNSHYVFMNSDVTTVFLDVLPRLKPGVFVHFHDIFLPYDYPPEWADRHYAEHYMLACCLLSAPDKFEVVLPNAYVSGDRDLRDRLSELWGAAELAPALGHTNNAVDGCRGGSFWLRIAAV